MEPGRSTGLFLAPVRPEVPAGQSAIDFFIRNRLEREGLQPSPEAARETLIRRVSLDLTGLPPTPAEMERSSRITPRMPTRRWSTACWLAAYGERMAARWLDAARYADTNGYQYDGERIMWRWRDWVIDAFNRNQPFDQFALEQIAGDMLPNATLDQKIATGFNRNHRANTEDGIIPEEYAVEYVVDRVETTSTVFLGLTLGCARCHNHKYDPFTQKEFYQFFAYFNNVPELGRAMKYGNSPPLVAGADRANSRRNSTRSNGMRSRRLLSERSRDRRTPGEWLRPESRRIGMVSAPRDDCATPHAKPDGDVLVSQARSARRDLRRQSRASTAGKPANFDIEDPFTLSAWVYSDATPDGSVVSQDGGQPQGQGLRLHLDHGKVHVNLTSSLG